ncbi:flagellar basal body-associated FliL family protein [Marinobacter changyiensis]|uniref:flagellar basal body-associated FliL family protein n=1 Tax=Marinobacter changyiensis TaxID=2604091 RepID=UPI001FE425D2|nr:flagellar basal body-associated FliL family protein [Marinobacter changyiensis]
MMLLITRLNTVLLLLLVWLPAATLQAEENDATTEVAQSEEDETEPAITLYVEMGKPFITHIGKPASTLAYLKANVSLRVSSDAAQTALVTHMPRLRHELVMLFGEQSDVSNLASTQAQEALRAEARARINNVLTDQQTGNEVQDVLFTTFVVQR